MSHTTEKRIDPKTYAVRRITESGCFSLLQLERLRSMAESDVGQLEYKLDFDREVDNTIVINMTMKLELQLKCERCLDIYSHASEHGLTIAVADNEAAATELEENYETVIIAQNGLSIIEIVEDEALLSLPLAPAHLSVEDCVPEMLASMTEPEIVVEQPERENPFAVLAGLTKN